MNQIYITAQDYDEDDDASGLSEDVSVAQSIESTTLEAILTKIESCKSKLKATTEGDDEMSVAERSKADELLKKLASAAIAVKRLESSAE
jgi:hypothetical protein